MTPDQTDRVLALLLEHATTNGKGEIIIKVPFKVLLIRTTMDEYDSNRALQALKSSREDLVLCEDGSYKFPPGSDLNELVGRSLRKGNDRPSYFRPRGKKGSNGNLLQRFEVPYEGKRIVYTRRSRQMFYPSPLPPQASTSTQPQQPEPVVRKTASLKPKTYPTKGQKSVAASPKFTTNSKQPHPLQDVRLEFCTSYTIGDVPKPPSRKS